MPAAVLQPSMAGGELSPSLWGRVDLAKYHVGLKTCSNFVVQAQGGAANRPGTQFVGAAHVEDAAVRLIPFTFNSQQSYALEFGDHYMRVISFGGHVTEAEKDILGITNANPAVVNVTAHGYGPGDEVYIGGVEGMVELNGRRFIVGAAVDADHFELSGVDSTHYGAFTGVTSGATITPTPPASGSGTGPGGVGYYSGDAPPPTGRHGVYATA